MATPVAPSQIPLAALPPLPPSPLQESYSAVQTNLQMLAQSVSTAKEEALSTLIGSFSTFYHLSNEELLSCSTDLNRWKSILTRDLGLSENEISTMLQRENTANGARGIFDFFTQVATEEIALTRKYQGLKNDPLKQHMKAVLSSESIEQFQSLTGIVIEPQKYAELKMFIPDVMRHISYHLQMQKKLCCLENGVAMLLELQSEVQKVPTFHFHKEYNIVRRNVCTISDFSEARERISTLAQMCELSVSIENTKNSLGTQIESNRDKYQDLRNRQIRPIAILCHALDFLQAHPEKKEQLAGLNARLAAEDCLLEIQNDMTRLRAHNDPLSLLIPGFPTTTTSSSQATPQALPPQGTHQANVPQAPIYSAGYPSPLRDLGATPSFTRRSGGSSSAPSTPASLPPQTLPLANVPTGHNSPTTTAESHGGSSLLQPSTANVPTDNTPPMTAAPEGLGGRSSPQPSAADMFDRLFDGLISQVSDPSTLDSTLRFQTTPNFFWLLNLVNELSANPETLAHVRQSSFYSKLDQLIAKIQPFFNEEDKTNFDQLMPSIRSHAPKAPEAPIDGEKTLPPANFPIIPEAAGGGSGRPPEEQGADSENTLRIPPAVEGPNGTIAPIPTAPGIPPESPQAPAAPQNGGGGSSSKPAETPVANPGMIRKLWRYIGGGL